ncbi:MAG: universal stress protein [Pseudomonadota bacterium]
MSKILACVDGSVYVDSVIDHAAWLSGRTGLGVELLQVLGRREATASDRSGRIVAGARRKLLEELAELDAERAKLLHQEAWLVLDEAKSRLESAGVSDVTQALRHGDLVPTLHEREDGAAYVVVGKRGEAADFAKLHLGSNLERIVRSSQRPILIASRAFRSIQRALVAFDGSKSSLKAIDEISRSPLYQGVEILILTAGDRTDSASTSLDRAKSQLDAAGLAAMTRLEPGPPDTVIANAVATENVDLLVMGAYGHSRLRTLVIGSTTSELIRACQVPIAVYR